MQRIFDLRGDVDRIMYKPDGPDEFGVAGPRWIFVRMCELSRSQIANLGPELVNQPEEGDFLVFNTTRGSEPKVIEIATIEDDRSMLLPYFEAHGPEVSGGLDGLRQMSLPKVPK